MCRDYLIFRVAHNHKLYYHPGVAEDPKPPKSLDLSKLIKRAPSAEAPATTPAVETSTAPPPPVEKKSDLSKLLGKAKQKAAEQNAEPAPEPAAAPEPSSAASSKPATSTTSA
jgi:hypothetical protein